MKKINISENYSAPLTEATIDDDNFIIRNVCLMGRKESKNNRVYEDQAVDTLTRLTQGTKCFANHSTKAERRDRGIRDIRDLIGIFESGRRTGNKIFANLKVREEYWPLMSDIARLQPSGTGISMDAMVKVRTNEMGIESVADVVKIRSWDVVSEAALTNNLFESVQESKSLKRKKERSEDIMETKKYFMNTIEGRPQDLDSENAGNEFLKVVERYEQEEAILNRGRSHEEKPVEESREPSKPLNRTESENAKEDFLHQIK